MKFATALSALVLAAGIATSAAAQDCSAPRAPDVPNGATASEEQMVQGQQAIKSYMAESNTYLSCLEQEGKRFRAEVMKDKSLSDADRKSRLAQKDQELTKKHNDAVDQQESIAARFNNAVREYRAANSQ